jgi:hypothetical protein
MGATVSTESNIQQHFLEFGNIIGGKINKSFHNIIIWLVKVVYIIFC